MAPHCEECDRCGASGEVGEDMRQCEATGDFICQACDDEMLADMEGDDE